MAHAANVQIPPGGPSMHPDQQQALELATLGNGVHDPRRFQRYSAESATVVRMYSDQDLSMVVWNLEPGQENDLHQHPENAHALLVLEGEGEYLRGEHGSVPIRAGDCVIVPRGELHGIRNSGNARLSYFAITSQGQAGYVRNAGVGSG
jgi:mannose-6-phosphate isomerase-like protein (cupin superfamily)